MWCYPYGIEHILTLTISELKAMFKHVDFDAEGSALDVSNGPGDRATLGGILEKNCEEDPLYSLYGEDREPTEHVSARGMWC